MSEGPQEPGGDEPESGYRLYRQGMALLEQGNYQAATVPLSKLASMEPDKSSVREALGRAMFSSHRFREAAEEFAAVVELDPVNDYAHFCLGRALTMSGKQKRGRRHLAIARNLRPDRSEYRIYQPRPAPGSK